MLDNPNVYVVNVLWNDGLGWLFGLVWTRYVVYDKYGLMRVKGQLNDKVQGVSQGRVCQFKN